MGPRLQGLEENPDRQGNFGTRDQDGNYKEKLRFDKGNGLGEKGKYDHEHHDGGNEHLPLGSLF